MKWLFAGGVAKNDTMKEMLQEAGGSADSDKPHTTIATTINKPLATSTLGGYPTTTKTTTTNKPLPTSTLGRLPTTTKVPVETPSREELSFSSSSSTWDYFGEYSWSRSRTSNSIDSDNHSVDSYTSDSSDGSSQVTLCSNYISRQIKIYIKKNTHKIQENTSCENGFAFQVKGSNQNKNSVINQMFCTTWGGGVRNY